MTSPDRAEVAWHINARSEEAIEPRQGGMRGATPWIGRGLLSGRLPVNVTV